MTDREIAHDLKELRAFAMDACVVIAWMLDTLAPPLPDHVQKHLRMMGYRCESLQYGPAPAAFVAHGEQASTAKERE